MSRRMSCTSTLTFGAIVCAFVISLLYRDRDRPHVPTDGVLLFPFGREVTYQECGFHTGQDWFAPEGSPLFAIEGGEIVYVGPLWWDSANAGRGPYAIVIDHGEFYTTYSHNASASVVAGQVVERGEQIGTVGNEGYSGRAHVHLEKVATPWTGDWRNPFRGCDGYVDPGTDWGWF